MTTEPPNNEILTVKRREILTYIERTQIERGYPPSVREIATACSLSSPASVQFHLKVLQKQGFLMRDLSKPRALTVNMSSRSLSSSNDDALSIPVIGLIAAGSGALALENPTDEVALIPAFLGDATTLFALRVKGDSMIGDGIFERDIIVARKQSTATTGELVIAGLRDETEATVKRIEIDRAKNRIVLKPSNPAYSPMQYPMDQVAIYGRVVFLQRQF